MRRSFRVSLTVVTGVALMSCGRRALDPCAARTFNAQACQDAVRGGGYYWNGAWFPMIYSHPYPYYYDSYQSYHGPSGGASSGVYARPGSSSVERGGFGSTGEAHGGSGGEGVGE